MRTDLAALLSVDHACRGCARPATCCCARYEVCVTTRELNRIIQVMPEAAKFCPRLKAARGYDNVFEEVEPGLHALDTTEDGLCVFAFRSKNIIRCSLHALALARGLPLEKVKPKACLLWPLSFSDRDEFLSLANDALAFKCITRQRSRSRRLSPALGDAIGLVYGNDFRAKLEKKVARLNPAGKN